MLSIIIFAYLGNRSRALDIPFLRQYLTFKKFKTRFRKSKKMIRIHQQDLLNSSYGLSYGHLKVAHAISMLDTPLIRLWMYKYYASYPPWAFHVEAVLSNVRYDP